MDYEQPVHSGHLFLPPVGKILIKKSFQQKYCLLFKASKFGIERLEVYDSPDLAKSDQPRIITLENCVKINAKSNTTFTVTTKTATYDFNAPDNRSMSEWLSAIQSVAFPDNVSKITSIEEDNELYCSSGEGVFNVKIYPSPASVRCGLSEFKSHTLVFTSTAIQLRSSDDGNKLLFTWPYCYIRRYGYKCGKFTFEAGRKCLSGEGTFFLEHSNQKEIFRCFATKLNTMKKLINENMPSPSIEEDPLQVALSMEAKSRSPIPPTSHSSSTSNLSLENSAKLSSLFGSMQLNELEAKQQMLKMIPSKPPRKFINNNKSDYEPIDKYDQVEYRSDAWRTMGVDDVKHTETEQLNDEEELYQSWPVKEQVKRFENLPVKPKTTKIVPLSPQSGDSYDKLNFFGSTSKLDVTSGYKQVIPPPREMVFIPPSFNEYDEIVPWNSEDIRPADDSHLGYALVRKEKELISNESSSSGVVKKEKVNHQFHNDEPYAVISKPKRV